MVRNHLYDPIPELFEAAALLQKAAIAHITGDRKTAESLLAQADMPQLFDWSEALFAGKTISSEIKARIFKYTIDPEKPLSPSVELRASGSIPTRVAREVIQRDGFFCRFCGVPVIDPKSQSVLRKAYPKAVRWGRGNLDKHTAFQALDLDLDHVVPRSLGGQNTLENLIVTCAPCNCGRGHHTLAEMGLSDPRHRAPVVRAGFETWDGLTLLLKKQSRTPDPVSAIDPTPQNGTPFTAFRRRPAASNFTSISRKPLAKKLGRFIAHL